MDVLYRRVWLLLAVVLPAWVSCTPRQYARQADKAAYRTIRHARRAVLSDPNKGDHTKFDVAYNPFCSRRRDDANGEFEPILLNGKEIPLDGNKPVTLTLDDALLFAVRNSRSFQDRKETLYTAALAVDNARRGWDRLLLGGEITGGISHSRVGKDPASDTNAASAGIGPTLTRKFLSGGALALAATLNFATDFLNADSTPVGSLLGATFTQPLLRGAWRDLAYEDQYRLERDFLFAIFDYERFTQTFAVNILTQYYSVLQRRDRLENDKLNIERLSDTVLVTKRLVKGGHSSPVEAYQAERDLNNAKVSYQRSLQTYEDALDAFKILIGLPMLARVRPDYPDALTGLNEAGALPVKFDADQAIEVAMTTRPDVLTRRAAVRDAVRDVEIAADDFLPQVDVTLGITAPSTGIQRFGRIQTHRATRTASLEFEYSLDQTDNRDAYRRTIIAAAKARRDYERFVDNTVRLGVRRSYRTLTQSRLTYQLQKKNVAIAISNRRQAILEQRAGRAKARDVLDAERDLRNARNGLTDALITYTTTRLSFLADLGMLWVNEKGRIHERREPFRFDRITSRHRYLRRGEREFLDSFDGKDGTKPGGK